MTDDLRTRISAIAGEHRFADHQTAFGDKCVCGWTSQGIAHSDHLADAVIRELGGGDCIYRYACHRCGDFWFDQSERMQRFALLHGKAHADDR